MVYTSCLTSCRKTAYTKLRNDPKRAKATQNGTKGDLNLPKTSQNEPKKTKLPKTSQNDTKQVKTNQKRPKLNRNDTKRAKTTQNKPKRP